MIIVLIGVSGCGKSCIGKKLSKKISFKFYDADDFHPINNIKKMSEGIELDDHDRIPWLKHISKKIPEWEKEGGVILACSALKESYRKIIKQNRDIKFIYLKGPKELIYKRMKSRSGHFMPLSLIDSQFATLEEPEYAMIINIDKNPNEIVDEIINKLKFLRKT